MYFEVRTDNVGTMPTAAGGLWLLHFIGKYFTTRSRHKEQQGVATGGGGGAEGG